MVNALLIYMGKTPKGYLNLAIAVPAEEDVTLDAIKDSIQDFVSLRVKSGYKIRVNGGNVVIDVIGKKSGAVAVALDDYIIECKDGIPLKLRIYTGNITGLNPKKMRELEKKVSDLNFDVGNEKRKTSDAKEKEKRAYEENSQLKDEIKQLKSGEKPAESEHIQDSEKDNEELKKYQQELKTAKQNLTKSQRELRIVQQEKSSLEEQLSLYHEKVNEMSAQRPNYDDVSGANLGSVLDKENKHDGIKYEKIIATVFNNVICAIKERLVYKKMKEFLKAREVVRNSDELEKRLGKDYEILISKRMEQTSIQECQEAQEVIAGYFDFIRSIDPIDFPIRVIRDDDSLGFVFPVNPSSKNPYQQLICEIIKDFGDEITLTSENNYQLIYDREEKFLALDIECNGGEENSLDHEILENKLMEVFTKFENSVGLNTNLVYTGPVVNINGYGEEVPTYESNETPSDLPSGAPDLSKVTRETLVPFLRELREKLGYSRDIDLTKAERLNLANLNQSIKAKKKQQIKVLKNIERVFGKFEVTVDWLKSILWKTKE